MSRARTAAFLLGCIGTRVGLAALLAFGCEGGGDGWCPSPLAGVLLGSIALGFALIYAFGLRDRGFEAGGEIWWDAWRPLHAAMYAAAAGLVWCGRGRWAGGVVLLDAAIGLLIFVHHRSPSRLPRPRPKKQGRRDGRSRRAQPPLQKPLGSRGRRRLIAKRCGTAPSG